MSDDWGGVSCPDWVIIPWGQGTGRGGIGMVRGVGKGTTGGGGGL